MVRFALLVLSSLALCACAACTGEPLGTELPTSESVAGGGVLLDDTGAAIPVSLTTVRVGYAALSDATVEIKVQATSEHVPAAALCRGLPLDSVRFPPAVSRALAEGDYAEVERVYDACLDGVSSPRAIPGECDWVLRNSPILSPGTASFGFRVYVVDPSAEPRLVHWRRDESEDPDAEVVVADVGGFRVPESARLRCADEIRGARTPDEGDIVIDSATPERVRGHAVFRYLDPPASIEIVFDSSPCISVDESDDRWLWVDDQAMAPLCSSPEDLAGLRPDF